MAERYELNNKFTTQQEVYASRVLAARRQGPIQINDPALDAEWAAQQDESGPKPYFDYFYTGEDMRVYVAETADDPEYGNLPVAGVGLRIEQEKKPVYGYWNYTYNAVMRGTRIITGELHLVTKHPDYMKRLLSVAAKNRMQNAGSLSDAYSVPRGWTDDEENLQRYWGKNLDASAKVQNGSIFSAHPPFSMVFIYGVQGTSVDLNGLSGSYDPYDNKNLLMYDHNQRLTESYNEHDPSRFILDGCEIMSKQMTFQNSEVCVEKYQFMARDMFVPRESSRTRYQPRTYGGGFQE